MTSHSKNKAIKKVLLYFYNLFTKGQGCEYM